jgi:hypothetical protein
MRGLLDTLISVLCFALFAAIALLLTPVIGGGAVRALSHSYLPAWLRDDIIGGLVTVGALCVFILALAVFGEVTRPRGTQPLCAVGIGTIAGGMLFLFTWAVLTAAVTVFVFHRLPAARLEEDTLQLILLAVAIPVFAIGLGALTGATYLGARRMTPVPPVAEETEPKST